MYPEVADEFETLRLVLEGNSIARYGDGEFNLVRGGNCVSQRKVPGISDELRMILRTPPKGLLVGIPRLDPRSPKNGNWRKCTHNGHYASYLHPTRRYYSAFITRPDSAPWIATDAFFADVNSLWKDQYVTFVGNGKRSLTPEFLMETGAKAVHYVECDYAHTYHRINELEQACLRPMGVEEPRRVLLCAGPTATCLAARLTRHGIHAVDLGHVGMWWMAHRNEKLVSQLRILP